jgi:hypothetical protein
MPIPDFLTATHDEQDGAMTGTRRRTATGFIAAAMMALNGCGGGGGSSDTANPGAPAPAAPSVIVYQDSLMLGSVTPQSLSFVPATTTVNAMIVSPAAAPLVAAGNTPLVSSYFPGTVPGAGIACISAPANSIGTVTGVNAGVNIKSVAVMLDGSWTASTTPDANWNALGASAAVFDGWENCGAKAEGSPSPSSTLTINADGSFSDNVFDGNPSTTVTIVDQSFSSTQAASMLTDAGYLDASQADNPQTIRLKVFQNAAKQTLLVEQGIPASGATSANPGFVAIYFQR